VAEEQHLLTKESVTRTFKNKKFLLALGAGGVVVIILVVISKNRGNGASGTSDEFVPEETFEETPLGAAPSEDFGAMFDELAGSISTQNQQQQAAIQAQIEAQDALLEGKIGDIEGQLQSAISGFSSQVPYTDPYAGLYADQGYQYTDPVYSQYGMDETGDVMTPVLEESTISYAPLLAIVAKPTPTTKDVLQPTTPDLRDASGGKTTISVSGNKVDVKGADTRPTITKVAPTTVYKQPSPTPIGKPAAAGVQSPGGTGVRTTFTPTPARPPAKQGAPTKAAPRAAPKPPPAPTKRTTKAK